MASKVEDILPPPAEDFVITTDHAYSGAQLRAMERELLRVLRWRLQHQTPHDCLLLLTGRVVRFLCGDRKELLEVLSRAPANPRLGPCATEADARKLGFASIDPDRLRSADELQLFNLLSTHSFRKLVQRLELALLEAFFLRFLPSTLAAAAFMLEFPKFAPAVEVLAPADPEHFHSLQMCVSVMARIKPLPVQDSLEIANPQSYALANKGLPAIDLYTRQVHHPAALTHMQAFAAELPEVLHQLAQDNDAKFHAGLAKGSCESKEAARAFCRSFFEPLHPDPQHKIGTCVCCLSVHCTLSVSVGRSSENDLNTPSESTCIRSTQRCAV